MDRIMTRVGARYTSSPTKSRLVSNLRKRDNLIGASARIYTCILIEENSLNDFGFSKISIGSRSA